ncbi:unnamed protein product [Notodromas monacha]|uniref:CSD domain-containing protein n=1 Tax=Notodromas monacha TaxID=399045 RepID=A0A7R9BR50_9CRUS|nr:unnamed protein product [Notodromas monacha]CAG0919082.1 unnamed protein product [Notodromas monacha]
MSSPISIPEKKTSNDAVSPESSPSFHGLTLPSPIVTRRQRTKSMTERLYDAPIHRGTVKYFSRSRGHGFITPEDGSDDIFVHISDIDGEFIPKAGDEVRYRVCPIPPKMEKMQAAHVTIIHFCPVRHQKWNYSLTSADVETENKEIAAARKSDEKEQNGH